MPVTLPEFPKLIRFDYAKSGLAQEWISGEAIALRKRLPRRRMVYRVASEFVAPDPWLGSGREPRIACGKDEGRRMKERPKEDWQRRKEAVSKK